MMRNEDNKHYFHFTGPQRLDKAMHSLEGIVVGTSLDGKVSDDEIHAIVEWIAEHEEFIDRHPFNEVIPALNHIVSDGVVDEEERADILWLCRQFNTENRYFNEITSDMQRLQGILAGITADGKITKAELEGLSKWLEEHEHLSCCWPYDEIETLIMAVRKDGVIDEREHNTLMSFFSEFTITSGRKTLVEDDAAANGLIMGVCAVCPEILFADRYFCFTGSSQRASRKEISLTVERLGGIPSNSVTKKLNYLVIGADGNPCWAFACYGRKVETAINYRKQGQQLLLVHEHDFWDAVEDAAL